MQIADRFHIHNNLMDAVNKALKRTIPSTNPVPVESKDAPDSIPSSSSLTPAEESGEKKRKRNPKTRFDTNVH